jgi:AraC family transcriptional regulator, regulatory protein of adaptative response / methylated-DNA-[protein]-cysteine methyltransferase
MNILENHNATDSKLNSDSRWQAVLNRDKEFDGEFVYAVKTTGVYCRPSCASRAAKRINVTFFDTTTAAAAAGFRACKRCRPDGVSAEHIRNEVVNTACEKIKQSTTNLTLDALAETACLSPHHFHRIFKSVTGVTPKEYQKAVQKSRMAVALKKNKTVTDAIFDAGFNSSGRFYEEADAILGMTARSYKNGGANEDIRYAVKPCHFGAIPTSILVAATTRGVCAIEFGDSAEDLTRRLRERFPNANFKPADEIFKKWLADILEYIEKPNTDTRQPSGLLDLPLDVQGTVFQQRVWKALRNIPTGETLSYSELAQKIGKPKAVRAVASACAGNSIAVLIPCHRVIRADGELSGYRWGTERKAELLRRESEKETS